MRYDRLYTSTTLLPFKNKEE